ncbi:hypothetical protein PENANT_c011G08483 [Penicillium antarcticum]|uniref:Thioredoxin-like fold domain-containing protein n=1 Tax=Penicillium antarcticum TaxID=416450 RepID=A0A1V6Q7E6_9EURO|nr:glutathione S-transferase [Penicillium antarcticum]KAJ5312172.1 glutathione S-transferase [Penicillium antarcticum]OQD84902.1 hypothetical protein PENANT_c011G08483 [Penicillium antarcticum]
MAEQLQLTLYRGFPGSDEYTWSPFVTKIELRLRFSALKYSKEAGSPRDGPRGKIPYLTLARPDGSEVQTLSDSSMMIRDLIDKGLIEDLNSSLSPSERTHDLGLRALLEEKLYFLTCHEKWFENYYTMRDHVLGSIPFPLRVGVGLLVYRNMAQTLHGQGTLRFTGDEIASMRQDLWEEINSLLVSSKSSSKTTEHNQTFWLLGGDAPTEADAACFGFITAALVSTACPKAQKVVKSLPVVVEYASHIHDRFFPEYNFWE